MGKLEPLWEEFYRRCVSLNHSQFKAPLEVVWLDRDVPGEKGYYENDVLGVYVPPSVNVRVDPTDESFLSAIFVSKHRLRIWGEKKRHWHYPNQTHFEIYGYDRRDTPAKAESGHSVDGTFAHEIGHHLFSAWAMNNGKSQLTSYHFSEGMAELFKDICYGGQRESPHWLEQFSSEEDMVKSAQNIWPLGFIYFADEVRDLIGYEKKLERLDPGKMFDAMIATWENMKGRRIKCVPERFNYPSRCTWETPNPIWLHPKPEDHSPLAFTRGEFAELFCDYYDCPDEFKPIFQSVSDNLRDVEY